jgi:uncharacterized protein YuzE
MANKKYDEKRDILYINFNESTESIPKGGFIVQLDSNGKIAGVEVHNATKVLSELTQLNQEEMKEMLENLENFDAKPASVQGIQMVSVQLQSRIDGVVKNQSVSMEAPLASA